MGQITVTEIGAVRTLLMDSLQNVKSAIQIIEQWPTITHIESGTFVGSAEDIKILLDEAWDKVNEADDGVMGIGQKFTKSG